jgi:hypothetical protein
MKVKLTIEVELEDGYILHADDEEREWFETEVLAGDGSLLLHSNEVGDTVGTVRKVQILGYS